MPRCRFFGNVNSFFGKSDPGVIAEWVQTVRLDSPKWILYSVLREELSGEEPTYFDNEFRRQCNPDVEKVLDEKYFLVNEMPFYSQMLRLYRLKE